ncbi:redoxin domain-containing protein [Arenimonas aestuarii]
MLRTMCVLVALLFAGPGWAADDIRVITSWTDLRDSLVSGGKSPVEADQAIGEMIGELKDMDRTAGNDRIGAKAPDFDFDAWLNSEPLALESLRGKVLLVRWWTDTCPFCASSAPALRHLHDTYSDQGLVVIGVFHPKARRDDPMDLARVERAVETRQFEFPVAVDWDWRNRTLKSWWLTGPDRPATSVTFLVDKAGVIQFVHPGMEYHLAADTDVNQDPAAHAMCSSDMSNIEATIKRLLAE